MVRTPLIVVLILSLFLTCCAAAEEPVQHSGDITTPVRQTVSRAISYLQSESANWLNTRKCAACHHVPMALWALNEAGKRGYEVDNNFIATTFESTLGSEANMIAAGLIPNPANPPDPRPMAQGVNVGTAFMAVAAQSQRSLEPGQRASIRSIVDDILKKQRDDGSWDFFLSRPPINESQTTDAVWIVMALQSELGSGDGEPQREALERATAWLKSTTPPDRLQDQALGLILSGRLGMPRAELQAVADAVLALQRSDGGWGQLPELPSDAFATGEVLYALFLAGYSAGEANVDRAIDFLVATQKEDGSWPMASRATPDGSPGSATLLTPITCAAAAWSTLGLASLVPH